MITFLKKRSLHLLLLSVILLWASFLSICNDWTKNRITSDVFEYYSYLPATFICKDISLKNKCETQFWYFTAPNGGRVFKMTMGMSMVYLPFFIVAHVAAGMLNEFQDGFSDPYQKMILFASIIYALIGVAFTFKSLRKYFSISISFITSLLIFASTNLLYYTSIDAGMAHAFLFGICSAYIYLVIKWHENKKHSTAIFIGILLGLMTLIRPTSLLLIFIFFLFDIKSFVDFKNKIYFLLQNKKHLLLIFLFLFLMLLPQLIYWKYITGNWIYYSYNDETFFWSTPHFFDGFFSYRKGWFVYTPLMFIACLGILVIKNYVKPIALSMFIYLPIFCYILFSWWCWWYGGSFGQRAFIDIYGLMAFPLASVITFAFANKFFKYLLVLVLVFVSYLNVFQTWQYFKGYIHHDGMTYNSYWNNFLKTENYINFYNDLWYPDYSRAKMGKPEVFSLNEIYGKTIYIMPRNLRYLSLRNDTLLQADTFDSWDYQQFTLINTAKDEVVIKTYKNNFICINKEQTIFAGTDKFENAANFNVKYLEKNYITLSTKEKKYMRLYSDDRTLKADSDTLSKDCKFRLFFK